MYELTHACTHKCIDMNTQVCTYMNTLHTYMNTHTNKGSELNIRLP